MSLVSDLPLISNFVIRNFPASREWIPDDDAEPDGDLFDQRTESGKPVEIPRADGIILVLDSD